MTECAERMNRLPRFEVSDTLERAVRNATVLKGEFGAAVQALKEQQGRDILGRGSVNLVQTPLRRRLLDVLRHELRRMTFPSVLGPGERLFTNACVPLNPAPTRGPGDEGLLTDTPDPTRRQT